MLSKAGLRLSGASGIKICDLTWDGGGAGQISEAFGQDRRVVFFP